MNIAIIVAKFNAEITSDLLEGARSFLLRAGISQEAIETYYVPGCYEIPLVAKQVALSKKPEAIVALGCVIRGETVHFDYVCKAASDGVVQVSLETGIPIGFGLLMVENKDQAYDRLGGKKGHRGEQAAQAALDVAKLLKSSFKNG